MRGIQIVEASARSQAAAQARAQTIETDMAQHDKQDDTQQEVSGSQGTGLVGNKRKADDIDDTSPGTSKRRMIGLTFFTSALLGLFPVDKLWRSFRRTPDKQQPSEQEQEDAPAVETLVEEPVIQQVQQVEDKATLNEETPARIAPVVETEQPQQTTPSAIQTAISPDAQLEAEENAHTPPMLLDHNQLESMNAMHQAAGVDALADNQTAGAQEEGIPPSQPENGTGSRQFTRSDLKRQLKEQVGRALFTAPQAGGSQGTQVPSRLSRGSRLYTLARQQTTSTQPQNSRPQRMDTAELNRPEGEPIHKTVAALSQRRLTQSPPSLSHTTSSLSLRLAEPPAPEVASKFQVVGQQQQHEEAVVTSPAVAEVALEPVEDDQDGGTPVLFTVSPPLRFSCEAALDRVSALLKDLNEDGLEDGGYVLEQDDDDDLFALPRSKKLCTRMDGSSEEEEVPDEAEDELGRKRRVRFVVPKGWREPPLTTATTTTPSLPGQQRLTPSKQQLVMLPPVGGVLPRFGPGTFVRGNSNQQSLEIAALEDSPDPPIGITRRLQHKGGFNRRAGFLQPVLDDAEDRIFQDLREAYLNSCLEVSLKQGRQWARIDVSGIEIDDSCSYIDKAKELLGSLGVKEGVAAMREALKRLEGEWEHLREMRCRYAAGTPIASASKSILKCPSPVAAVETVQEAKQVILELENVIESFANGDLPLIARTPLTVAKSSPIPSLALASTATPTLGSLLETVVVDPQQYAVDTVPEGDIFIPAVDLTPGPAPSRGLKMLGALSGVVNLAVATPTTAEEEGSMPVQQEGEPGTAQRSKASRGLRLLQASLQTPVTSIIPNRVVVDSAA